MKKTGKALLAVLMAAMVMIGIGVASINVQGDETPPAPATSKTITDNGDGTYNLNLSVTGSASSTTTSNKADIIVIFDTSGSMNWGMDGTRQVPNNQKRITIAKNAVNSLAEQLLGMNTTENPNAVRLSLVSFDSTAVVSRNFTTNQRRFRQSVNGLQPGGGTNWEDALQTANGLTTREDASVYVIFVSDGNPTFRLTRGDGYSPWDDFDGEWHGNKYVYGTGSSDPNGHNYNFALEQAKTIVNAGKNFYSIGVSNDVTAMEGFAEAVGQKDNYYSATDEEGMEKAFSSVISSITNAMNFQNVVINDGITAATSSVVLQEGSTASDYTYTISAPNNGPSYTIELDDNGTIVSINGAKNNVTLTDSISNSYELKIGAAFPAATSSGNGVQWDLSAVGRLLNGYTYTVSFKVWPSQDAYDTLAGLLNGYLKWEDVDQTQYTRTENEDGTYSYGLRTNTNASVSYDYVKEETGKDPEVIKGSSEYDDVPTIELVSTKMDIKKEWNGAEPENENASVTFELLRDEKDTGFRVVLSKANEWKGSVYLAPGIQVGDEILDPGHAYELKEISASGFAYYQYEFESAKDHPMLVDGKLVMDHEDNVLIGTNHKKSSLNITKTVVDKSTDKSADAGELFTFEIEVNDKLENEDEDDDDYVWFSIGDGSDAVVIAEDRVSGATAEIQEGEKTGYYYMQSGSTATVKIKRSENIYFINLSKGSTYKITEVDLPAGYSNTVISGSGGDFVENKPEASGTILDYNTTYQVAYTNEYDVTEAEITATKKVEGWNAFEQFELKLIPSESTQKAIDNGEIDASEGTNTAVTTTEGFIKKDGTEKVSFGKYKFYKEGIYTFTVDETTTTVKSGWTYDASTYDVTVTVAKNSDGKLVATIDNNNPMFTNKYEPKPVEASIPVEKTLNSATGLTPPNIKEAYTFTLEAVGNAPMPETGTNQIKNPDERGGIASFNAITYTEVGTYQYKVSETGEVKGVTNDTVSTKTVEVVVTDDGKGQLVAEVNKGASVEFVNTYEVGTVTVKIPVEKILQSDAELTPPDITGEYTFTLVAEDSAPMPETGTNKVTNPTATGGTASFDSITYKKPGTYEYTITESGEVAGVENDPDAETGKTVTVEVTDNGDGTLSAVVNDGKNVQFTNTYSVQPTTAQIPIEKVLDSAEGLTPPDITSEYTFTLAAEDSAPMPDSNTVTNPDKDGGKASFGEITYTKPGTYEYTITESGEVAGVENDPDAETGKTVKVEVTDNGDGTLSAVVNDGDNVEFTNTYSVKSTTAKIPVEKILQSEKDLTPPNIAKEFTFTVTGVNNAPMPEVITVVNPDADGGVANFGEITYDTPGTYEYSITESGNVSGVTNDTEATKTVKVVVTDNKDGTLTAVVNDGKNVQFTNTYSAKPAAAQIAVKKVLDSEDGLNAPDITGKYTFTLATTNSAPLPESTTVTNPDADGGTASFDSITYTKPGTYEYTITESGSVDGVTNDTEAIKTVTVEVKDNGQGQLVATSSSTKDEPVKFTNTYSVKPTTAQIFVQKDLESEDGLDTPDITGEYTFTLAADGSAPLPDSTTVTNPDADGGTASFDSITYTKPGTYEYTITESGEVAGVENDPDAETGKTVTVVVTDNGNGTLSAVVNDGDNVEFTNTYSAESATAQIFVKKVLKSEDGLNAPDITEKFTFTLTSVGNAPMPKSNTVKNPEADGGVAYFEEITYDAPGTYTYAITESGSVDGVTNDTELTKTVTVKVEDNGKGQLVATSSSTEDEPVTFTNTYSVESATAQIFVQKDLESEEGLNAPDITGKYTFTLATTNSAPLPESTTVTNPDADGGKASFDSITYTKPGTYEYTITESGSVAGVTNDPELTKTVTVEVKDNREGQLVATSSSTKDEPVIFTNTYTVSPITSAIYAYKQVTGMELEAGEYTFVLTPTGGAPGETQTVTNDEYGYVEFREIEFTKPGTFAYTVREVKGEKRGVSYDATTKSAIAHVKDNLDGTLSVLWYTDDLKFTNSYAEATVRIGATKTIEGRDWNPEVDIYEFTLKSEDGTEIQTVKNDPAGNVTFDPFILYEPGEYTYTIEERPASIAGVTTDPNVYRVKVVVTEDYEVQEIDDGIGDVDISSVDEKPTTPDPGTEVVPASITEGEDSTNGTEPEEEVSANETELEGEDETNGSETVEENTAVEPESEGEDSIDGSEPEAEGEANPSEPEDEVSVNETEPEGDEPVDAPVIDVEDNVDAADNSVDEPVISVLVDIDVPDIDIDLPETLKERVLKAEVTYLTDDGSAPKFVNTYKTNPESSSVTDSVEINKTLVGRDLTAGEFTFVMSSDDTELTAANDANGNVVFDAITFTEPGTYSYTISEVSGSDSNIEYDTTEYRVSAEVVDNLDGTLSVSWNVSEDSIEFTNTWNEPVPDPIIIDPPVEKVVKGSPETNEAFTFRMVGSSTTGTVPMPEGSTNNRKTVQITGAGSVEFGDITITEPGTYTYVIGEIAGSAKGYTYDTEIYTVKAVVTLEDGKLVANVTNTKSDKTKVDKIVFTNEYSSDPTPDPTPTPKPTPTNDVKPAVPNTSVGEGSN